MILESYSNKVGTAELIGIHVLFFINACCLFLKEKPFFWFAFREQFAF